MSDAYLDFLRAKVPQAEVCCFEPPSTPHPSLFPHQVDIALWMIRGGRRACFANFGLGKTRIALQLDIIKRLITRYTNRGELVFDPFMGIGSVGYQAIRMGRRAIGTELNVDYWRDSVGYMEMAEREVDVPTLFDLAACGAVKIGEAT